MSARPSPSVSIGVPTYNRVDQLSRALESILNQTHSDLEVVISDNGSNDGTRSLCEAIMREDPRVRYLRHPQNRGPIANFNSTIDALRGTYVGLLADDDWLDHDYVERCLSELRAHPDHSVIGGLARYVGSSASSTDDGLPVLLVGDHPVRRVRRYLRDVEDNGIFYGLMRREALYEAAPMRDVLGADWILVAGLVYKGKARTLDSTRVNRSTGGTSRSVAQILRTSPRSGRLQARLPFVCTAGVMFAEIAWRSKTYSDLGPVKRFALAVRVAPSAMRWLGSIWLLVGPATMAVLRTPFGKPLRGAFELVLRRFGRSIDDLPPL